MKVLKTENSDRINEMIDSMERLIFDINQILNN